MKIMNEYTYESLKKNKRYTISILVSIIIASSLLCSLCIFLYSIWDGKVNDAIEKTGYWQGELKQSVSGDKLKNITENPEIESTMIKGNWFTAKLSNTKRDYLLMRDADKNFWDNMNFKNLVIQGRLPKEPGEIVISKLFFIDNPSYKVGDKLTLPIGNRKVNNEVIKTQSTKQEGETFEVSETKTYTIVGELDISEVSAFPGYPAMGYLNPSDIKPDDGLTIYLNFINPRKIYSELPKAAQSVGLSQNEKGEYDVLYNTKLLSLYGIIDKNNGGTEFIVIIAMAAIMFLLIMGAFVLIIYNGFSMSANSRIKELSILKSLGASPKQIKSSVLYEGFLLWIVQIPISLIIGYGFSYIVFSKVNAILKLTEDYRDIHVCFSPIIIGFSLITSLITVLVSAYIPARKVSKISVISGIRQNEEVIKIKKPKKHFISRKIFGIEGELAKTELSANKKSLRTAFLSLSMCFILIAGYISIISIYNLAYSKNIQEENHDLTLNINIQDEPNEEMINKISKLPQIKNMVIRRTVRTSTYVTEDEESDIFSRSGGFSDIDMKYDVLKEDDKYRIIINLIGLSHECFEKYCKDIGTDYSKYYNENMNEGILINSSYHTFKNSKVTEKIPLLNIKEGSNMLLNEKIDDSSDNDNNLNVMIGCVTDKAPTDLDTGRYSLALVMPMEKYMEIVKGFSSSRSLESNKMCIDFCVEDEAGENVKEELKDITSSYLGSEDFSIWSLFEEKQHEELVQKAVSIAVCAVALMIGAIGIFNAFSIVSNNMRLRRREFSMLRSVGLTPKGLNKILSLEALFFALKPIILSIPFILIISMYMLSLTSITWKEFISVLQLKEILIYGFLIFTAILLSYSLSSKSIKKSNIIECIKDEII